MEKIPLTEIFLHSRRDWRDWQLSGMIRAYHDFVYQVFQLPQSVSATSWILDTHYAFLEQRSSMRAIYEPGTKSFRYGGWREGLEGNSSVPANSENSAVYFNNKVCKMIFVEQNVSFVQMLGTTRNGDWV